MSYKRRNVKVGRKPLPLGEAAMNSLLTKYKWSAQNRGIEFALTREQFKKITSQNCHYCNRPANKAFTPNKKCNGSYPYNGIDRVYSDMGYIIENCVPCCTDCNYAKRDLSEENFLSLIEKIYKYRYVTV